jgi:hypothetical protein
MVRAVKKRTTAGLHDKVGDALRHAFEALVRARQKGCMSQSLHVQLHQVAQSFFATLGQQAMRGLWKLGQSRAVARRRCRWLFPIMA